MISHHLIFIYFLPIPTNNITKGRPLLMPDTSQQSLNYIHVYITVETKPCRSKHTSLSNFNLFRALKSYLSAKSRSH